MTPKTDTLYEKLVTLREQQRSERAGARNIVKARELPLEKTPHGTLQWYLHPAITDTAIRSQLVYVQHIPPGSKSGKQHHPGGAVMYAWKGKGHTVIDDKEITWEAGDLLQLPSLMKGTVFQHFNDSPEEEARILVVESNLTGSLGVERGSRWEELENAPEWQS